VEAYSERASREGTSQRKLIKEIRAEKKKNKLLNIPGLSDWDQKYDRGVRKGLSRKREIDSTGVTERREMEKKTGPRLPRAAGEASGQMLKWEKKPLQGRKALRKTANQKNSLKLPGLFSERKVH